MLVKVSVGRQQLQLNGTPDMTFGQLRQLAESEAGSVEGGFRLLHRGKSFPDDTCLADAKVVDGTKMMALPSQKQREADKTKEKAEKAARDGKALKELHERRTGSSANAVKGTSSTASKNMCGDPEVVGATFVFILHGKDKFRINIELSASVLELKQKAEAMDGIDGRANDMRVLRKGKVLEDVDTLSGCGAKEGSSMMLLFSARHHDAKEAKRELSSIEADLTVLEQQVQGFKSRAEHRFLDATDLALEKGQLLQTLFEVKDRLKSIACDESRRNGIESRLQAVDNIIAFLS